MDEELASFANPNTYELIHLGRAAFNVLGQWAPRCWVVQSLIGLLGRVAPGSGPAMRLMLDPWLPGDKHQQPQPDTLPLPYAELVFQSALGGVLHRMYKAFPSPSVNPKEIKLLRKTLPVLAEEGVRQGLKSVESLLPPSIGELQRLQQLLSKVPNPQPGRKADGKTGKRR